MAQLNDLLTNISNIKEDIKQAIINKGQNISKDDNFNSYAIKIGNIETGSMTPADYQACLNITGEILE